MFWNRLERDERMAISLTENESTYSGMPKMNRVHTLVMNLLIRHQLNQNPEKEFESRKS